MPARIIIKLYSPKGSLAHTIYSTQYKKVKKTNKQSRMHTHTHPHKHKLTNT